MSPAPQLAEPGSSSYSSDTLHVGDGTWDSSRDTFLLPNLQTLNFATMQYNGMGNRFRALTEYHNLILGHGVLAAITFLGVVPAAVMIARFYRPNPRMALRMHIWLQIITLFLVTVIFILGWFAVGPERSLTNPHHDIGLTIYVLVWFQILWGWLVYRTEKGKARYKTPIRLMLHQWLGRATALLALAQIGSGLYLYGSPRALFIVYGLALGLLIFLYFVFSYRAQLVMRDDGSYYTETDMTPPRREGSHHRGLKTLAGALGGAAAIEAFRRHRRSQEERRTDVTSSRPASRHSASRQSDSYYDDEKFSEDEGDQHKWRNRLFGAAAAGGTIAAVRGFMNRRRGREDASDVSSYTRPLGPATAVTQDDISRVNAGHPPASPAHIRRPRPGASAAIGAAGGRASSRPGYGRAGESISSYTSIGPGADAPESPGHEEHHGVRNGLLALGVGGYLKHLWSRNKQSREDRRVEEVRRQDRIQEEMARRNSRRHRYTGDGSPSIRRPGFRPAAGGSIVTLEDSAVTGSNPALSRQHLARPGAALPQSSIAAGSVPSVTPMHPPPSNIPMPPGPHGTSAIPLPPPPPGAPPMPLPPPPPLADPAAPDSGSEGYGSPGGGHHRRHRLRDAAAAGTAMGMAGAAADRPDRRDDGVESPPVSVKVKMHNDGRHVTLRRLNEAEAAAERDARNREGRRRHGSMSSLEGAERWRRTEAMEAAQAAQASSGFSDAPIPIPMPSGPARPQDLPTTPVMPPYGRVPPQSTDLPPPPPIPASGMGSGLGAASPPSTMPQGTETDLSNYESNRRRRRAARAAQGYGSGRVEFQ